MRGRRALLDAAFGVAVVLLVLVESVRCEAAPIVLIEDLRFIHAEFTNPPSSCGVVTPLTDFGDFDAERGCIAGVAYQTSTASETELAGRGTLISFGGGFDVDVESHYEIRFSVSEATPFVFDLDVSWISVVGWIAIDSSDTEVVASLIGTSFLGDPLPPTFEHDLSFITIDDPGFPQRNLIDGPTQFHHEGILGPGIYNLKVSNRSDRQPYMDSEVDFTFTVVPEPSPGILLSLGLAFLSGIGTRPSRNRA